MAKITGVKVTLSSGKVVLLREMKISHTELAAQEVAVKANGDPMVMQILMQKAVIKNLLFKIDDKEVSAVQREDMDSLFSMSEYSQLVKVVNKMSGGDEMGKDAKLEIGSFGDN